MTEKPETDRTDQGEADKSVDKNTEEEQKKPEWLSLCLIIENC